MTHATIRVAASADHAPAILHIEDIDFDESRDKLGLAIGRRIVDTLYKQSEGL